MDLTEQIKAKVKESCSDRYKLAVQVHIGAMQVRAFVILYSLSMAAPGDKGALEEGAVQRDGR